MARQMTIGNHPVLPPLRDQHHVKNFPEVGKWDKREKGELESLSEGLKVEKIGLDINSIPDMWARPLLFEMALFDPHHPLHERVVGEWQGLLAMLALKETTGISSLTAVAVSIPDAEANADQSSVGPDFMAALSKLTPKRSLSSDTLWNDLYVLLFDGAPIGMTSPTTLVATATDYYGRVSNVPWFDGRYLTEPTPHLGSDTKQHLADWLKYLERKLNSHPALNRQDRSWNALLGLLTNFIAMLGKLPGNLTLGTSIGFQAGIFTYISSPVRGVSASPDRSHVRLVPSRQDTALTPLLVMDRNIASQWQVQEHDLLVWGSISLKTAIPFSGVSDDETRLANDVILQGAKQWKPEKFFTSKLFVVGQESAFPGALKIQGSEGLRHQQQLVTPILPIARTLLDYLTADDLADRISFEQTTTGILARLRLPLAGPDLNGRDYEVLKEFRAAEHEIIFLESVPVIEVWPNFKLTGVNWNAYYTYFSTAGAASTFSAKPYTPGMKEDSLEVESRRITQMDRFPEALVCEGKVANVQTNRTEMHSAGLLLISQPAALPAQNGYFKIGIDFGASGTSVYAKNADPFPVDFKNRFLKVTDTPPARRSEVGDFFLPTADADVEIPFLSIFHDFLQAPNSPRLRPFIDGHIFFLMDYLRLNANAPGIATDLKWSARPEDRVRVRAFLEQLCLMTAAEVAVRGASQIEWAYSFPTAFTGSMSVGFPQIWSQVTQAVSTVTGLAQAGGSPRSKTESEASALFFKSAPHLKASTHMGTVCIDIGGSTSDIAIWQEDKLRWQTSLRFAGREIFLNFLYRRPEFLAVFGADVTKLREVISGSSEPNPAFYAQADAILRQTGRQMFETLPSHAGSEPVRALANVVALGLSGLFFYVGSVLRYLMDNQRYKEEIPDIYVGGNGSLMFHWLDAGEYRSASNVTKLFKETFSRGAGLTGDTNFKITISPNPKEEAAYGLVADGALSNEQCDPGVVAGEAFRESGHKRNWNELLDSKRMTGQIDVESKPERLQEFIETFNSFAKTSDIPQVVLDDVLLREVRSLTASSLSQFRGREDDSNVLVEPIFILELKHLLEVLLSKRDQK